MFKNSEGIAESYGLSSLVIHVDTFTSHTCRTPKTKKFMALSLHFNFAIANVSALFVGLVVSTLGGFRVLPVVELEPFDTIPRVPSAPVGLWLCPLVFLARSQRERRNPWKKASTMTGRLTKDCSQP